jgi:hypothetical protein
MFRGIGDREPGGFLDGDTTTQAFDPVPETAIPAGPPRAP